jgi:hypothetical protein
MSATLREHLRNEPAMSGGHAHMRDVYDAVADGLVMAEINVAPKAEVWGINDLLVRGLMRQYKAEIVRGKKKAFYTAVRAAEEMISLLKRDRRPALRTLLFYC